MAVWQGERQQEAEQQGRKFPRLETSMGTARPRASETKHSGPTLSTPPRRGVQAPWAARGLALL